MMPRAVVGSCYLLNTTCLNLKHRPRAVAVVTCFDEGCLELLQHAWPHRASPKHKKLFAPYSGGGLTGWWELEDQSKALRHRACEDQKGAAKTMHHTCFQEQEAGTTSKNTQTQRSSINDSTIDSMYVGITQTLCQCMTQHRETSPQPRRRRNPKEGSGMAGRSRSHTSCLAGGLAG